MPDNTANTGNHTQNRYLNYGSRGGESLPLSHNVRPCLITILYTFLITKREQSSRHSMRQILFSLKWITYTLA